MKTAILCSHYFHVAELREALRTHYTIEERLEDLIEYQEKLVRYYFNAVTWTRKKGGDVMLAWRRHQVAYERLMKLRRYLVKVKFFKELEKWGKSLQSA